MKRILTAVALTAFAAAGAAGAAGTAAADTGGVNLPSVVPLSGVLTSKTKPAGGPALPPVNAAVERLLPGGR
ncbi:chaplin [Streptomyces sp. NPDC086147]|uniref:chaplin n=1 Tax=Streptomyces sp. NPDC086147 TaxID=3155295 RepID=UPI00344EDFD4